jgi:hypothetical protein
MRDFVRVQGGCEVRTAGIQWVFRGFELRCPTPKSRKTAICGWALFNGEVQIMEKKYMVTVRLSENEINGLNDLTNGQLTRSQIIRILLQDFLEKPKDGQQKFLIKKLFGPTIKK